MCYKRGFVIIYVLILMIPVMLISTALIDLTVTDFKANHNIVYKKQTLYNSEAGILDGVNRYNSLIYDGFRYSTYYINFASDGFVITTTAPSSNDYVKVKTSYVFKSEAREYTIESVGYFNKCEYKTVKIFMVNN